MSSDDSTSPKRVRHSPSSLVISDNDETAALFFEQFCRRIPIPGKLTVTIVDKKCKISPALIFQPGIKLQSRIPGKHKVEVGLFLSPTEVWLCSIKAEDMRARHLHELIHSSPAVKNGFFAYEPKADAPAPAAKESDRTAGPKRPKAVKLQTQVGQLQEVAALIKSAIDLQAQSDAALAKAHKKARQYGIKIHD